MNNINKWNEPLLGIYKNISTNKAQKYGTQLFSIHAFSDRTLLWKQI